MFKKLFKKSSNEGPQDTTDSLPPEASMPEQAEKKPTMGDWAATLDGIHQGQDEDTKKKKAAERKARREARKKREREATTAEAAAEAGAPVKAIDETPPTGPAPTSADQVPVADLGSTPATNTDDNGVRGSVTSQNVTTVTESNSAAADVERATTTTYYLPTS